MNYLDAWRIVNDYIDFYANGINQKYYVYSTTLLPFAKGLEDNEWKESLINASCIFWSHALFWRTRTIEQLKQYYALISNDGTNWFVNTKRADNINEAWDILGKGIDSKLYKYFNKKKYQLAEQVITTAHEGKAKSLDERDIFHNTISHMENYLDEICEKYGNSLCGKTLENAVRDYCTETYRVINLEMPSNAVYFFWTFEQMRELSKYPDIAHYYNKYSGILFRYDR